LSPTCGDGNLVIGEECDDGVDDDTYYIENPDDDDGNCVIDDSEPTRSCLDNICGDGYLFGGIEECDDGNFMNGDGCDSNCSLEVPIFEARVFVRAGTNNGSIGGVAAADSLCQSSADSQSLGGTWKAWISSNTEGPSSTFATNNNGPYKLLNGTIVANNWADLTDGTLRAPIILNQFGTRTGVDGPSDFSWTGTKVDGTPRGGPFNNCGQWTTSSGGIQGYVGDPGDIDNRWTAETNAANCNNLMHLYCFEQVPDLSPPFQPGNLLEIILDWIRELIR
jgi:cysteine-rich repeat protein